MVSVSGDGDVPSPAKPAMTHCPDCYNQQLKSSTAALPGEKQACLLPATRVMVRLRVKIFFKHQNV